MSEAGTRIHKLGRNERPMCEDCCRETWLEKIKIADFDLELRTYECRHCAASKTLLVEPPWKRVPSLVSE
jgi:hypothetical protein